MTTHIVEIKPSGNNPLGRRFLANCRTCGPLTQATTDLETAIEAKSKHVAMTTPREAAGA